MADALAAVALNRGFQKNAGLGDTLLAMIDPIAEYKDPSRLRRLGASISTNLGTVGGSTAGALLGLSTGSIPASLLMAMLGGGIGRYAGNKLYKAVLPPRWAEARRRFRKKEEENSLDPEIEAALVKPAAYKAAGLGDIFNAFPIISELTYDDPSWLRTIGAYMVPAAAAAPSSVIGWALANTISPWNPGVGLLGSVGGGLLGGGLAAKLYRKMFPPRWEKARKLYYSKKKQTDENED